ncbi:MAG TPA: prolyl oligopeptidase family serine peptidase [Pyrinomonadaceae bacterium]|nr:prolyl oligopeptidase family serine peptidase [Pyrinomonadaceae bacterium]
MSRRLLVLVSLLALLFTNAAAQTAFDYPKPKKVTQVDDYHGTKVNDPFRWMEDSKSADLTSWIDAENKITDAYFATIPQRDAIKARLTELWNYERYSSPSKVGNKYIYTKNDGLQNQSVIYITDSINDPGKVFFDPNKLTADGTAALNGSSFTDDGKLWAYGVAVAGSDRTEWKVMNVETGELLSDTLKPNRQGGVSWLNDNSGFYYNRFPDAVAGAELKGANKFPKLYFHKLGTPQSEDALVYERPDDGEMFVGGNVTEDGKWLIIRVAKGTERMNMVYFKNLSMEKAPILPLIEDRKNAWNFVGNDGPVFYFTTDKDAERGKLVSVNVLAKDRIWKDIVPQADETLNGVQMINDQFVLNYLKDASTQIEIFDKDGKKVRDVELPGIGSAGGFGGRQKDTETFYSFTSYNSPPAIYRYDMKSGKSTLFRKAGVKFDGSQYEVKQVFFTSKDGTKVPMFITHKKGIKLDGTNPTILYGYGGFNISQTPGFSVARVPWLEMGGVYAVANIRGGAEYGKSWWANGARLKKQNVFDDFIGAGEWLIANNYTSNTKLAIQGGSNGGLLVGAVLNQRPDLFGAALPAVGVMDMVRFTEFTVGAAWKSDYGDPKDATDFKALYAYSPLHNIKAGTKYPATLVTTSDHDDRVFPAHSFKYTATLQEAQAGGAPILIRIETRAGHGAGKPTSKQIQEQADIYAFLVKNLGVK